MTHKSEHLQTSTESKSMCSNYIELQDQNFVTKLKLWLDNEVMDPFVMIAERNWEHPWKEKQIYIIFAICIPNEHLLLWRFALPASPDDLHRMFASNIRRNRFLLISISQAFLNDIIIIIYWCAQYLHEFNFKMYHTHHVSARGVSDWANEHGYTHKNQIDYIVE